MNNRADALSSCVTLGDNAIFDNEKTAFLCSRKLPCAALLKIYDWAQTAAANKHCIISGFHTAIEDDVWKILMNGDSPLIWVCARGIPKKLSAEKTAALQNGKLLIISPFADNRQTQKLAHQRNLFILENADKIIIGHATANGRLSAAITETQKPVKFIE